MTAVTLAPAPAIVPPDRRGSSRATTLAFDNSSPGAPGSAPEPADPGRWDKPAPRWMPAVLLAGAVLGEAWVAVPYACLPVLLIGLFGLWAVGSLIGPRRPARTRPSDVDVQSPLASLHREATTGRWSA